MERASLTMMNGDDWAASNPNEQLNRRWAEPYVADLEVCARIGDDHAASVVIVAYKTNRDLIACLESLRAQSCRSFETLVVDNGGNESVRELLRAFPITYVRLNRNYGPSLARNVGIAHARGDIICFLDDDALAHTDFVAEHLLAHAQNGVNGVRGRILPRTDSVYNALALHYDLGPRPAPSYIDVEGNASFKRSVLVGVGGFAAAVFGGEGVELSYRIFRVSGDRSALIYWPKAVIHHDFALSLTELLEKTVRGAKMAVRLHTERPDLQRYVDSYHPLPQGDAHLPRTLRERLQLAALRRVERNLKSLARSWYRWRLASWRRATG